MKKLLIVIIGGAIVLLSAGVASGYFWGFKAEQKVLNDKLAIIRPLRENDSSYKFINPLLLYIVPPSDQEAQLVAMRDKVNQFIATKKADVKDASIYFTDLNRGTWIGVNQSGQYDPASMLKVVIMVAYLKESEANPEILQHELTYSRAINNVVLANSNNASSQLKIDVSYKVADLINAMIVNSDNGATTLLLENIPQKDIDSLYTILQITKPNNGSTFTISPIQYSRFFRMIYSTTYLGKQTSEEALTILSKTTFKDGIVAGLPSGIVVSHKFGERITSFKEVELHDCGIVYYPEKPYLLCVMTKGRDLSKLKDVIKNISQIVYDQYPHLQ
jgi:beta-lactamase class A